MKRATLAALFGLVAALPVAAQQGLMDSGNCSTLTGWAFGYTQYWQDTTIGVDLYDGTTPLATAQANLYRSDLAGWQLSTQNHGYSYTVPARLQDGQTHYINAYAGGTHIGVGSASINCPRGGGPGYQYYYSDPFTSIDSSKWIQNGSVFGGGTGLWGDGSLISSISVPDGSSDYEVKTILPSISSFSSEVVVSYLRASNDAQLAGYGTVTSGTFYAMVFGATVTSSYPNYTPVCTGTASLYKVVAGSVTILQSISSLPCHDGTVFRAVAHGSTLGFWIDNALGLLYSDSSITVGKPGVGVPGNGANLSFASLGPIDSTPPLAPDATTFSTSLYPTGIDFRFPGTPDNANGSGVALYKVLRDGSSFLNLSNLLFSDQTLAANTTHTYTITAQDYHFNMSSTSFSITTPAAGATDPRRVGVRSTGAYWGATGEQIDVRSANLNFALPLLQARGRLGWQVPFTLSYNSQNWRHDARDWNLGEDVGYGYGWKLGPGSLVPFWSDSWTVHHYVFIDSTGAEYRLDQNSSGIWTSRDSIYVTYDSNANRLYFRDGSFWVMGSSSAGTEGDAGSMYPTVIEDTSGNQILIRYYPGVTLPWMNTSGRIRDIEDVRATTADSGVTYRTYTFIFTNDVVPHLTSIQNWIGTSEGYLFSFAPTVALTSPFASQTFGGMTGLSSMQAMGINMQYSFVYNNSGELTQATLPYGGYLKYAYGSVGYSSGFTQREVQTRYLSKDGTVGSEKTYAFLHESGTSGMPVHQYTILDDPGGVGEKYWAFSQAGSTLGLVTQYQGRQRPGPVTLGQSDFTWTQDAAGNSYIASTLSTADPGQSYAKQKKTDQTVDIHGNVTQVKQYDFGNLSTPARTYNYSYDGGVYLSYYRYNLLVGASVTGSSGGPITLASNTYASGTGQVSGPSREWENPAFFSVLLTSAASNYNASFSYDSAGNMISTTVNGVTTQATVDSTTNFAAPTQVTVGSLSQSMNWNSFLGLTNGTAPNGDSVSYTYDLFARTTGSTSAFGASSTVTYSTAPYTSSNPATITTTTNGRWNKQTVDGLGRTVKTEAGDASGTLSVAETQYDSYGGSPMGMTKQTALAHAPGATPVWTTYTYDGIGRTLSAATVGSDAQGATAYAYQGNTVTVTDPAGKWKKQASDAFGQLLQVNEPNPAGGSDYVTTYGYDALGNLTSVSMPRPTGTQTRTMTYNGKNLMSSTNPENGTVNYTYNSLNKVATRIDAKNQKVAYVYDSYGRLQQIIRYPSASGSWDACQSENYFYDSNPFDSTYSQHVLGRLAAVQYRGGYNSSTQTCDTTFTEMYTYSVAGATVGKRLQVARDSFSVVANLDATFAYDNEGRMTAEQYPLSGPHLGITYDTMGRLLKLTDLTANQDVIQSASYGPAGGLLNLTGVSGGQWGSETRTYNSVAQLTQINSTGVNIQYRYPATQDSGKIASQYDVTSGEEVSYAYDTLNRLISAVTTNNSNVTQWGQSYAYDGFGNLTDITTTKGSTPELHTSYDPATNHGASTDANGNTTVVNGYAATYDIENRLASYNSSIHYSYTTGNKRIWRGLWSGGTQTVDEVTLWGLDGEKLAMYNVYTSGNSLYLIQSGANYYFGGKLIKNVSGAVYPDRLGSVGKYYPYGQEKPSATTNGTEKFTGYIRDSETGLDYADQRYHNPGAGRFLTPDPFGGSAKMSIPESWNRYWYVSGDPVNHTDPSGQCSMDFDGHTWDNGEQAGTYGWQYDGPCNTPDDGLPTFRVTSTGAAPGITQEQIDEADNITSIQQGTTSTSQTGATSSQTGDSSVGGFSSIFIRAPHQSFVQCMTQHAEQYSLVGITDSLLELGSGHKMPGYINKILSVPYGNPVTTLYLLGAGDNGLQAGGIGPAIVHDGMGNMTSYGRRTTDILSLNLSSEARAPGGVPLALGRSTSILKGILGTVGNVLGGGLTLVEGVTIGVGLTGAEAINCSIP